MRWLVQTKIQLSISISQRYAERSNARMQRERDALQLSGGSVLECNARFRRGRAQPAALEQSARSFKFGFQIREVSIQLIFRDSFAAVELFDAAPDFCTDYFPVLQARLPRRCRSRWPEAVFGFWPQRLHRGFRCPRLNNPPEGDQIVSSSYLRG